MLWNILKINKPCTCVSVHKRTSWYICYRYSVFMGNCWQRVSRDGDFGLLEFSVDNEVCVLSGRADWVLLFLEEDSRGCQQQTPPPSQEAALQEKHEVHTTPIQWRWVTEHKTCKMDVYYFSLFFSTPEISRSTWEVEIYPGYLAWSAHNWNQLFSDIFVIYFCFKHCMNRWAKSITGHRNIWFSCNLNELLQVCLVEGRVARTWYGNGRNYKWQVITLIKICFVGRGGRLT